MLETNVRLTHDDCGDAEDALYLETGFAGHESVTDLELCAHYTAARDQERAQEATDEIYAENAWLRYAEGGWDPTGTYLAESLMTTGGQPAYDDPQAWI